MVCKFAVQTVLESRWLQQQEEQRGGLVAAHVVCASEAGQAGPCQPATCQKKYDNTAETKR